MKRLFLLLLLIPSLMLTACRSGSANTMGDQPPEDFSPDTDSLSLPGEAPEEEPLKVVATIFPPYDFVRQIAGENVELTLLLSPGAESHSYDPTPQDLIAIQNSDLFLYVGGESDVWVERILESLDTSGMTLLALLDLVEVVEEELVEGMESGHEDEGRHEQAEYDEHVWTAPENAMLIVERIAVELGRLDPGRAALYEERGAEYLGELEALHRQFQGVVESAARRTVVFGDRFPFRYLADAYGLEYFAAFPGCSTETEASAATVAFLLDKVAEEEIPVVFHIELSNEKMADAICEGTGAEKRLLHSCHNVTRDDFVRGATYLELMEQNAANLREALS